MIKYIPKKSIIFSITFIYSILIGILYSLENFKLTFIAINTGVFLLTILLYVIGNGIFLIIVDNFMRQGIQFKIRFSELVKAILISKLILLPISLLLLGLSLFIKLDVLVLTKVITISLNYVSPFILLFSYKLVTKADWNITIKVVSIAFLIVILMTKFFHY